MTMCLLIDEEGRGRSHLGEMLSGLGLETSLTSGADEAVRLCNDNAPDVVMLSARANGGAPMGINGRFSYAKLSYRF